MDSIRDNRRVVLIGVVALLLLCLIGVMIYNFISGNNAITGGGQPTAATLPTEEVAAATPATPEEATATPTRVISEQQEGTTPTPEPTETQAALTEPTETPTPAPTATRAAVASSGSSSSGGASGGDFSVSPSNQEPTMVEVVQTEELLKNGSFEEGFDNTGVGEGWRSFKNEGAAINFSPETTEIYVKDGEYAQKISIDQVQAPDRYGGIYQTLTVMPGETYTLTLHGQIRSPIGNVQASSYGYRVQYTVDNKGGEDWRKVPAENWVELPWDEQLIGSETITYSKYMAPIKANSDKMTLFVRAWNKWSTPGLAEYSLDSLSLIGPVKTQQLITPTTTTPTLASGGGQMINQPLPVTGLSNTEIMADGRFWGAVVVLALLALGAIFRAKWRW